MENLKPCPFCGEKAQVISDERSRLAWVKCQNCDACSKEVYIGFAYSANEKAIAAWNRRVEP